MSTQKPIPSQLHQHVLGTSCNLILAPLYINIIMVFDWFWSILYTLEEIDIPPNPCETKHLNTQTHCWTCFLLLKTNRKDEGGKAVWTGRSQACGCNDMHLYKAFGVEDWSGDGFDLWGSKKMVSTVGFWSIIDRLFSQKNWCYMVLLCFYGWLDKMPKHLGGNFHLTFYFLPQDLWKWSNLMNMFKGVGKAWKTTN